VLVTFFDSTKNHINHLIVILDNQDTYRLNSEQYHDTKYKYKSIWQT
ncbi:MAG: hypothetical protein ACJA19_001919, partial [Bacteroidia bacterium]